MKEFVSDSERQKRTWANLSDLTSKQLEDLRQHLTHKNRQKANEVLREVNKTTLPKAFAKTG